MKLAVYTIPYEIFDEANKINSLFDKGLESLHIRKPGYSRREMIALIDDIVPEYHNRIVIHSNYSLSLRYDLGGLHISTSSLSAQIQAKFLKAMNQNLQIFGTVSRTKRVPNVSDVFDSIMIGPLYVKFSESNIKRKFEPMDVINILKKSKKEIYALGGIDMSNVDFLKNLGFKGAILQTSIWKSHDILNSFNSFQLSTQEEENPTIQIAI